MVQDSFIVYAMLFCPPALMSFKHSAFFATFAKFLANISVGVSQQIAGSLPLE